MDILRFITAGSVDDGKSTLIGRLLYDSKSILSDELESIKLRSKKKYDDSIDLALLTDGLRAEREQGITIDVAYRYFSTSKRKFIIADAPGHIQYTRNMITGASNSDLAIILVDARNGIIEQTRRHSLIVNLLGISHVILAINKMDFVNYCEDDYKQIVNDYSELARAIGIKDVHFIPISAKNGDNVVERSNKMNWYVGKPLLEVLETIQVSNNLNHTDSRFPVQYVIRPESKDFPDYRGYAGRINNGSYKVGDEIVVLPSGATSKISAIEVSNKLVNEAYSGQSAVIHLDSELGISRGDLIVKKNQQPVTASEVNATLCWLNNRPAKKGVKFFIQQNSQIAKCVIQKIDYLFDVNTMEKIYSPAEIQLNDIAQVTFKISRPISYDPYEKLRSTGGAILIDETNFETVGACLFQ